MRYKHVIWDWNGTLLNDVEVCVGVLKGMLSRRGLAEIEVARYRELFDFPVQDFYSLLGVDFAKEGYDLVADEYIAGYRANLDRCRLQEGAEATLGAFSDTGLSQSVLSAYHQKRLEEAVEMFGLAGVFEHLIGLNDYAAASKLENGKWLIEQLEHDANEVLMVGDTLHDYEVAQAMGVGCVLLSRGHQSAKRLRRCGVAVLDSMGKVAEHVLRS